MYAIYGNIYHQYTPNVSYYSKPGATHHVVKFLLENTDRRLAKWQTPDIRPSPIPPSLNRSKTDRNNVETLHETSEKKIWDKTWIKDPKA